MGQAVAARGSIGGHQGSAVGQQPWLRERLRGRGLGGVARAAHEAQTTEVCTAQLLTHHSVAAGRHLDPRCALRAASRAGGPQRRRWVRGWTSCCASASSASHTSAFKSSMSDSTVRLSGSGHRELAVACLMRPSSDLAAVPPRSRRRRIQVARCCRACPLRRSQSRSRRRLPQAIPKLCRPTVLAPMASSVVLS